MGLWKTLLQRLGGETAERRQHARVAAPAMVVTIDGVNYTALDWSLGGCRIKGEAAQFRLRQHIQGHLQLDGADERGEFMAEVVRIVENGDVGLRWLELSPHIFMTVAAD